ncbi:MAG: PHP domain-containing protein [Clostridiales bacterium]|jgi:predicted metal-dependent phosphoesterase TrpH|nr:PHP domain-containing protein [Clostridiales bacterium]
MNAPYDLHTHSNYSDGTDTPERIVRAAGEKNVWLVALTDHDTIEGVPETAQAGGQAGVAVLPGIEINTQSPFELHILGLGVDIHNGALQSALKRMARTRQARSEAMLNKLKELGVDAAGRMPLCRGNVGRLHIALALVDGGYAKDVREAFTAFLDKGRPAYIKSDRLLPEESIALIHAAGGIAVLAHPCHIRDNPHKVVRGLYEAGLDGIEAYYPTSTVGQRELFLSLAAQYGLFVTCGSDYHGLNRPGIEIGCAWEDTAVLRETAEYLQKRTYKV